MKRKILLFLLAVSLLSNVATIPAYAFETDAYRAYNTVLTAESLDEITPLPEATNQAEKERTGDQEASGTTPTTTKGTSLDPAESIQPSPPTAPATEPSLPTEPSAPLTPSEPTTPVTPTEPTTPSTPTEPVTSQIPTALEIDTENIYQGMDMAYEDGYSPRVGNGYAYLVLPLLSNGDINNEKIKASLNLGSSSSSPFVITNYEKNFELETVSPKNSVEEQTLFLVRFDIQLAKDRVNGVYPVTVNITGYDASGSPIDCIYTLYVTITDGKSNKPVQVSPEIATAEPVVYISKCVIQPEKVMAGQEFTQTITMRNSLTSKSIRNMMVKVDTGNLQINLLEDTNVFQIEKIPAGGEAELTIRFNSDASIPAGKYNMSFAFNYDSSKALNLSSSSSTIVDIQQPANMELVMPRFAQAVNVGETIPLSLQVINMGRDKMYNVRCIVSGFGFSPSNTGYIGTMDAGSAATTKVDLYIIALNASEGNENGSQYGATTGTVTLIYEDDAGEEFRQETQFDTEVKRPIVEVSQVEDTEEVEERASLAWWFAILTLGGVTIAAVIGGFVIKYKSHKTGRYL